MKKILIAVLAASRYALEKARAGQGPVLVEAETYRLGAHTTADDPTKYRLREDEQHWSELDPLLRLEAHLREAHGTGDGRTKKEAEQKAAEAAYRVLHERVRAEQETGASGNGHAPGSAAQASPQASPQAAPTQED